MISVIFRYWFPYLPKKFKPTRIRTSDFDFDLFFKTVKLSFLHKHFVKMFYLHGKHINLNTVRIIQIRTRIQIIFYPCKTLIRY